MSFGFNGVGAHTTNSSLATAVTLTPPTTPLPATKLLIQAFTQNVRFTLDGTTPTASVGYQLKAGDPAVMVPISVADVVKVIEETASAQIAYQWGV